MSLGRMVAEASIYDELQDMTVRAAEAERRAELLEVELEKAYALLPGAVKFLADLGRTSILPIRSRAAMWSRTLGTLLPDENDRGGE